MQICCAVSLLLIIPLGAEILLRDDDAMILKFTRVAETWRRKKLRIGLWEFLVSSDVIVSQLTG